MRFQTTARRLYTGALALLLAAACSNQEDPITSESASAAATSEAYTVLVSGTPIGHLKVEPTNDGIAIDYDFKNNGRGPTIAEAIAFDHADVPTSWTVTGTTTFGNEVNETFAVTDNRAEWTDATGSGEARINTPSLYISQFASPYAAFIQARALLNDDDGVMPALPAGEIRLTEMETVGVAGTEANATVTTYALSGADLNPDYFALDSDNNFFAYITPEFIIIRDGFEGDEAKLRAMAETYSSDRFEAIQAKVARRYNGPVRIQNVRIFDPESLSLTAPASVVITGDRITAIEGADASGADGETVIDGAGGSLIPGLYDMHGHMGENSALLNVAAGVTSVRDMGNDNEVLGNLIERIENGTLAGPRITRSGFIEGKSPFSSNNGEIVESQEEAIAAVRKYADEGFYQVKLYNSMTGEWAPAIVEEAHRLGLKVAGHVPAFSNANAMIRAGFDELTHINQVMLGWVLAPDEDTRTLLRLTALKRLPDLDLDDPRVNETLDLMVDNGVVIDPTLAIHEYLLLSRNGETRAGVLDYIDHMPANVQRGAKVALAQIANEEEDIAYRGAYEQIVETLRMMKDAGIFIVFGTDLGGAFNLHRELELYQQIGFTPAEILRRASYDMADYMGQDDLGSIEVGKLADFFLVPEDPTQDLKAIKSISMVSRGGAIYFPSEIYPEFGIRPFTDVPAVSEAE
ncbi:MAG: amidohydrolase family protein [Pseudomonadota bacterium]